MTTVEKSQVGAADAADGPTPDGAEVPHRRHLRPLVHLWDSHPGVRSHDQLTLGERAADHLRNTMGSWGFVFGFLGFMALWALLNSLLVIFGKWDAYPFILLNLFLSMLAGLQGAILLIAAKRADQISSELAQHDFETDQRAAARIEEVHQRLVAMAEHNRRLLETNSSLLEQINASIKAGGDTSE
jgi:uncharacterized membrane protein